MPGLSLSNYRRSVAAAAGTDHTHARSAAIDRSTPRLKQMRTGHSPQHAPNRHRYIDSAFLWPPYVTGQDIVFLPCSFFLPFYLSFFFSSPNLSGHRVDVYHTLAHGVALVRV